MNVLLHFFWYYINLYAETDKFKFKRVSEISDMVVNMNTTKLAFARFTVVLLWLNVFLMALGVIVNAIPRRIK